MNIKCSKCKKIVDVTKGYRLKPKPICSNCVLMNEELECKNGFCKNKFKRKDGWLDECWECHLPVCKKCVGKSVEVKGVAFSFCEEHINYDMKQLVEDAEWLIEEENSQ